MSYIGQGLPADTFQGFVTDSFTGDGSATTFTLSKEPFSEDTLIVVINNVIQKPTTNFTVSGTTLTIVGTAVADGDVIYAIHMGGPLPIGGAAELDLNGASDKLILDADADTTISADTDDQIDFKAGGTDTLFVTNGKVGITNAPDLGVGLHIKTADTSGTVSTNADELVIEGTRSGMTFLAANDNFSYINFGDDGGADRGSIRYSHSSDALTFNTGATEVASFHTDGIVFNEDSNDQNFRIESNSYTNAFFVDANEDAVFVGTTSFYDTNTIFAVRSGSSSQNTMHISNNSGSSTGNLIYHSLNIEEGTGVGFQLMADYNDNQIFFRGDGNGFFDGAADAGDADFAEYFESTDGSAIDIGKTVVLDNGKVRASTDSDNASDIVGVVRHRKTVGIIGNSAWSKWKGKYKVDDYGVPLLEEYTITEWDQVVTEDADDLEITDRGKKKKLPQVKGDTIHHSYATDKIPSELTAPSDAVVKTKDDNGNTFKRKILSDSYDASKTYVSREDRNEWNLIGLTGQVTMTKGQKTGDRWIKMRDISDTVEEWLIR
jgi:hypothetical protein